MTFMNWDNWVSPAKTEAPPLSFHPVGSYISEYHLLPQKCIKEIFHLVMVGAIASKFFALPSDEPAIVLILLFPVTFYGASLGLQSLPLAIYSFQRKYGVSERCPAEAQEYSFEISLARCVSVPFVSVTFVLLKHRCQFSHSCFITTKYKFLRSPVLKTVWDF